MRNLALTPPITVCARLLARPTATIAAANITPCPTGRRIDIHLNDSTLTTACPASDFAGTVAMNALAHVGLLCEDVVSIVLPLPLSEAAQSIARRALWF